MINPLAGLAGGIVGMGADMILAGQQKKDQLAQQAKVNEAQFNAAPSPYSGDGFNQLPAGQGSFQPSIAGYSGLRMGGALERFDGGMPYKVYAEGGAVGHVIPAENTGRAIEDARRMGMDITAGAIAGSGHPKTDDKTIQPEGTHGARVSSGEIYVDDATLDKMARGALMTSDRYAQLMYPNEQAEGRAMGGGLSPTDPPYKERSMMQVDGMRSLDPRITSLLSMSKQYGDKGMMWAAGGQPPYTVPYQDQEIANGPRAQQGNAVDMPDAPKDISGSLLRPTQDGMYDMMSMLPRSATTQDDPQRMDIIPAPNVGGGAPQPGQLKAGPSVPSMLPTPEGEGAPDELERLNRDAAIGQAIPMVGTLAYNLFSKRDSLPAPRGVEFTPLDLNTEGLAASLGAGRARATATATANDRGNQSEGRGSAIHANNLAQTQQDAATVQGVKNQEATVNNQLANQAEQINTAAFNQFQTQEALANQQFRMDKMGAVNESLSGMAAIAGGYLNNRVDLKSDRDLQNFRTDYLKYLGGAKGYENMSILNLGAGTATP